MPDASLTRRSFYRIPQPKVRLDNPRIHGLQRPSVGVLPIINKDSPLARGLIVCIDPLYGDVLSRTPLQFAGTARRSEGVRYGPLVATDDTDNDCGYVALPAGNPLYSLTNVFSVAILVEQTASASFGNILSVPYVAGSWAPPYNAFVIFNNTSLNVLRYQDAGPGGGGPTGSVSGPAWNASQRMYGVARNAAAATRFYVDGVDRSADEITSASATDWNTKQPVVLLNATNSSLPNAGITGGASLTCFWNRFLSAAEMMLFFTRPWSLYR